MIQAYLALSSEEMAEERRMEDAARRLRQGFERRRARSASRAFAGG